MFSTNPFNLFSSSLESSEMPAHSPKTLTLSLLLLRNECHSPFCKRLSPNLQIVCLFLTSMSHFYIKFMPRIVSFLTPSSALKFKTSTTPSTTTFTLSWPRHFEASTIADSIHESTGSNRFINFSATEAFISDTFTPGLKSA